MTTASAPTRKSTPEDAARGERENPVDRLDSAAEEAELLASQRRRNRILLVVLLAIITLGLLASQPLFNKYHDPYVSDTVISH